MVEKLTVIFFIILFLLLGAYLILLPWNIFYGVGSWEQNYLLVYIAQKTDLPLIQKAISSNWARGAVTGLGVLNILIAFWELAHFKQSVEMLKGHDLETKANVNKQPASRKNIKLIKPLIYLITEGNLTAENFDVNKKRILEIINTAVENKISLIQIREKKLAAKLVFELTAEAAKITKNSNTKLLVNDRADIALAAKADGVHLTENSISAAIVRRSFPKNFIIGVSTHSNAATEKAKLERADFVVFSPVFSSPGKGAPVGLKKLTEVCSRLKPFPVIALGGIDKTNYRSVLETGASGFAAIRFLNDIENMKLI